MRARRSIRHMLGAGAALTALALVATGCATANDSKSAKTGDKPAAEVTITDNHGKITVPVNPKAVVALDNTVMQTLNDWDISLVAAPKGVMGTVWPKYIDDKKVLDVGNHREPDLEQIVKAKPDLVIGGYRFSSYYDKIKAIQPKTIEIEARDGKNKDDELKRQTTILGDIFNRKDDAKKLNDRFDKAIADAKAAYDGKSTVIGLISSGGKLGFAAPSEGRGVGVLFDELGLKPGIERKIEGDKANHKGDEIGVEAIAQANPDWLVVLDRDGAFQEDGYVPALDVIKKSEALKNVTAVKKNQIIVLDKNFYLTEGIQAYTDLYEQVAKAFTAAK